MANIVFDDNGGIWSGGSAEFHHSFIIDPTQQCASDYAVSALGFVVIDRFQDTFQLRLAPGVVFEKSLASAFDWLKQRRTGALIGLAFCSGDWNYTYARSLDAAATKVFKAIAACSHRRLEPLLWRPTALSEMRENSKLPKMLSEWSQIVSEGSGFDAARFAACHLGKRFAIAARVPSDETLRFKMIGGGFGYYGADWAVAAIGRRIDDQPDTNYGRWVAETYRAALHSAQPLIDDCDVLITPTGGSRARLRIRRIVLPFKNGKSGDVLISGSFHDDKVDLRRQFGLDRQALDNAELSRLEQVTRRKIRQSATRAAV